MHLLQTQAIDRWRRAYPRDWLLIEVDRVDPRTTTPLTGRLIARAKQRASLEKRAARTKRFVCLVHGSDDLPRGYVAAF